MKTNLLAGLALLMHVFVFCQSFRPIVSAGTRTSMTTMDSNDAIGKGLGGQVRVQFSKRLNSEWYQDKLASKSALTGRNEDQMGWSMMYYVKAKFDTTQVFQPFLIMGQSFDKADVFELEDETNSASVQYVAVHGGLGTHVNISPKFDCSLSGLYVHPFGKEIESIPGEEGLLIQKAEQSRTGHLLFTVSINYKILKL